MYMGSTSPVSVLTSSQQHAIVYAQTIAVVSSMSKRKIDPVALSKTRTYTTA
jgi:hypothetical protein